MRKIKLILLLMGLLLTINVKADDCESSELARLKDLAKKVDFDYDYKLVNNEPVFSITAVNLNEDLKVLIMDDAFSTDYKEFVYNDTHKSTIDNFKSGEKVNITIKGYVVNFCSGKTVGTRVVRLPYYNYYYSEEKCKGYEDFKYCKPLISSNISEKEFDKQFELYLKSKESKQETPTEEESNSKIYLIIGAIVFAVAVISVVVISINKRRKKNML